MSKEESIDHFVADALLYASTAATALTFASFVWIGSPARMNRKIAF